jgi:S-adenosylmethionine hydrolase
MITVKAYLYPNTAEVQVFDPTIFTTRNRVVYSRPIKVYQGIDNPIQVIVRNQDQKGIDLTGYIMQAQIQDPTNGVTVETYAVTFADITKGLANFTIDRNTINTLEQRFYKLTFKTIKQSDNTEQPIYIDDNYGVPLDLQVLPAYYADSASDESEVIFDGGVI